MEMFESKEERVNQEGYARGSEFPKLVEAVGTPEDFLSDRTEENDDNGVDDSGGWRGLFRRRP